MSTPERVITPPIAVPAPSAGDPSPSPRPGSGRPPSGMTPRSAPRRSIDCGTPRRGQRHTVEVPENAERHEGLVVSRQEKFGFIKCSTTEGRYFFHVNDCDGQAIYGSTVSFVIAKDLTTGKDVAYHAGPAEVPAAAAPAAASPAQPLHHQQQQQQHRLPHGQPQQHPQQQGFGHQRHGHAPQHHGQHGQQGQHGQHGRTPYEHFGQHRQPSPASQRDWRLPREPSPAHTSAPAGGQPSRHSSGQPSAEPSGELAAPARYRGTVAQPARAGRHHSMDDGLLLYIDEQGAQQQARYGNGRLAEGCPRLEPGDVVEFELVPYPGAGPGHRKAASAVRFLSKSLLPTPSLEAALAASEADPLRGRQLGRVALLKKEFGFIRQMERPGDMFFHFSQLEGWGPEEVKVGDDVEYTIRRDHRDPNKLSAVQIRRAPPGAVIFETVSAELIRGVVVERPQLGKQYVGSSGVLEYTPVEGEPPAAGDAGGEAAVPGAPGYGRSQLPFSAQDVTQGGGSLRVGDHVTFRTLTNLQAARAAAQATVPGAAAYAGRRAVEVSLVKYAGLVVQVNKERQFGFISFGEDQMLVPGPPSTPAASSSAESEAAPAGEEAAPAAAASDTAGQPAAAGPEGAPATGPAEAGAEGGREGPSAPASEPAAPALPAAPSAKRSRIFFHFKEVSGQYILKPGDEVVFVMHTNLKSGELNAQRVRRTKEGPELPEPEPAPKPAPAPAVNPNRQKYSGNLSAGSYKAPKIAKGPDGTRGFEFPRPNAVMPPLPGLEPKPEEEEPAEQEAAAAAAEPAAAAAAAPAEAEGAPPAPAAPAPVVAPGLSLAQQEARQAHAAAAKGAAAAVAVAPAGSPPVVSPTWRGGTPFSELAAMSLADAGAADPSMAQLKGLGAHLSAEAPPFVPGGSAGGSPPGSIDGK
ncbi:hypothetical protein ABPG77_006065 [Micractinium sp. CCAP 211/92]